MTSPSLVTPRVLGALGLGTLAALGLGHALRARHPVSSYRTVTPPSQAAFRAAVAALANEVRVLGAGPDTPGYLDFLTSLPIHAGAQRGYDAHHQAQPDLLTTRARVLEHLTTAFGADHVFKQPFVAGDYAGVNVLGVWPGQGPRRDQRYVVGAHYDSVQNAGADDNASGVAGLLTIAHALRRHAFDATIVLMAFDQEELHEHRWAQGSLHAVTTARRADEDLRGVVVMDMIGLDPHRAQRGVVMRLDGCPDGPSRTLQNHVLEAFARYTPLTMEPRQGPGSTDAESFCRVGIPAVAVSEVLNTQGRPLSRHYHTPQDRYESDAEETYLDPAYAAQVVRGVLGWLAEAAGPLA